jgi:hypothetical protein
MGGRSGPHVREVVGRGLVLARGLEGRRGRRIDVALAETLYHIVVAVV